MVSIIIPTLNEEDYLPRCLESLKRQDFLDCEIIVADAGSKDKTIEIAQKYGCTIVPGGLPAKARNNGARVAKGELLFFLDADTILPDGLLKKSLAEFNTRNLDIATFCLEPYPKNRKISLLVDVFYNIPMIILEKILPHAAVGIIIKKDLFERIHGFDQTITLAEDHDMARRATKFGRFGILRSGKVLTSDRRSKKDGWFRTGIKFLLCELHMIFIGPVRSNIFNYKFNHYKD